MNIEYISTTTYHENLSTPKKPMTDVCQSENFPLPRKEIRAEAAKRSVVAGQVFDWVDKVVQPPIKSLSMQPPVNNVN